MKLLLIILILVFCGCATNIKKLNTLYPGMMTQEVVSVLGNPDESQFYDGMYVLRYSLFKPWYGKIPCYIVVDPKTNRVTGWTVDYDGYYQNQAAWGMAIKSIDDSIDNATRQPSDKNIPITSKPIKTICRTSGDTTTCIEQ